MRIYIKEKKSTTSSGKTSIYIVIDMDAFSENDVLEFIKANPMPKVGCYNTDVV